MQPSRSGQSTILAVGATWVLVAAFLAGGATAAVVVAVLGSIAVVGWRAIQAGSQEMVPRGEGLDPARFVRELDRVEQEAPVTVAGTLRARQQDAVDTMLREPDAAMIRRCLTHLDERERLVLTGTDLEGRSAAEMARLLGVSTERVEDLHRRALTTILIVDELIRQGADTAEALELTRSA